MVAFLLWTAVWFVAGIVARWAYDHHRLDAVEAKLRDAEARAKAAVDAKAKEVSDQVKAKL